MSFLGIEGYHVFITGAAGGIGQEAVKEFLGTRSSYRPASITANQC
jgi:NAD(P)-dependent dehydrogenase (short-subunit alcohol dehydrogenase family)